MRRRKYKVHLVTFSDGQLQYSTAQQRLVRSALESGGVDYAYAHSPKDIPSEFYARHREILDLSRGGGYWLWKPFFILQRLAAVANGDFVIYWDAGRGKGYKFCRAVDPLLEWADSAGDGAIPGVSIPVYGSNAKWTKRDCFVYMDCDNERFWQHPQIQATYSVWKKTTATMDFVATWLRYCGDPL
jgi:hypothetical protein